MPTYYNKLTVKDGNNIIREIDLSQDTITSADDIPAGKYGHLNTGERVLGTGQGGGSMWKDKKICVFGDSIGYGYNNNAHSFVDILSERNVFADVHKNCVSGSTTATLTARLQESADEVAEADIIYCEYEANDIVGLKAGTLTTDSLVSTVRNCTSYIHNVNPTCTIIWMPLTIQHLSKIAGADLSYYQAWVNAMYSVFAELGINMIPIFDTLNANHASSDGRHPNDAGHEAIADLVMQMPLGTSNYPTALMTEWTGGAY